MTPSDGPGAAPDTVDLRDVLWPVEDVGQVAASAASAAVTALEYHCNRTGEAPTNLSSLFIHYNARAATGDEGKNTGTTLEAAMKAIATHGACRDASWPFDASKLTAKPPAQAYEEAKPFAAIQFINPADILESVALRYPVPFVARLPERCLHEAGRTGVLPAATPDERQRADAQMNHAMVVVGYDKGAKHFIVRNCWGKTWGNQGHCKVPFDLMSIIAPYGTQRLWIITKTEVATSAAAATAPSPRAIADPPAPTPAPEKLSDLAAKMRAEIRGDLHRDLADAQQRIRDMLGRKPAAPPGVRPLDTCSACLGRGSCWGCGGTGCDSCGGTGRCPKCNGQGTT